MSPLYLNDNFAGYKIICLSKLPFLVAYILIRCELHLLSLIRHVFPHGGCKIFLYFLNILLIIFSLGLLHLKLVTDTTTGKFFLISHIIPHSVTSGIPIIHVT